MQLGVDITDSRLVEELDRRDQLAHLRSKFHVPLISELLDEEEQADDVDPSQESIYLCSNSLGLQPKEAKELVVQEMDKWAKKGVHSHFAGQRPFFRIEDFVLEEHARMVGARTIEVATMNSLTVNIHLSLVPFYRPTKERHKIIIDECPFPSDLYAIQSQVRWHGYDPSTSVIFASRRKGEDIWYTEDIVKQIEEEGDSIAVVYLSGVHFTTGYYFDIKTITEAAHKKGCYVGFDLAHAVGNVELHLHDWEVDFASWCTYKYMCSGPGGIGGFFIHEKHAHNSDLPRFLGWWSHNRDTRFVMDNVLDLQPGAAGFQLSNPPVLPCMTLLASLNAFGETSMAELCRKSRLLTGYLELLLEENLSKRKALKRKATQEGGGNYCEVITPSDPERRGCQLSLRFSCPLEKVSTFIQKRGVAFDLRRPNLMRVAPVPMYNTFADVLRFFQLLTQALECD